MKDLSTLIPDIYELFNPDKEHIVNEENLQAFLETLGSVIKTRLASREENEFALRFSKLGKQPRQLWFEAKGRQREEMSPKTYLKFLYGDVIEALLLFLAKESGHTVTDEQKEVEIDGVKGHIDAKIDGIIVDVKSASPFGFKKFKDFSILENDPFGYIQQLSGYGHAIDGAQKEVAFFAFDKVSGDMCLTSLSPSVIKDFNPKDRITFLKEVISNPTPPEKCFSPVPDGKSGNEKLSTECSYCSFKKSCYPEARCFIYSTGPKWLTKIIKEPNVYEVKDENL